MLSNNGKLLEELKKNNITYYRCHAYPSVYEKRTFIDVIKGVIRECITLMVSLRLFFLFRNKGVQLIHTNSSVTNVGAYLSLMLGVPHIWHFREFVKQHYKLSYNWGECYQKYLWKNCANTIISISNILKKYYDSVLTESKIVTIYNGIDSALVTSIKPKKNDFFDIAIVGVIHPGKHQDIALKAIGKVVHKYNVKNVHLHVYGNCIDENYLAYIKQIVVDEKIQDYITFHGFQLGILQKTESYHVGIVASEYEAFGRVTIEYMLNQMIPIVSNSGANTEIVHDGVNGFVFELNDVESLATHLVNVVKQYRSLNGMLRNIEETTKHFTVEANANGILTQYREILR